MSYRRFSLSLREKFDISNVRDMEYMFNGCTLSDNFTLGKHFDVSNVINMESMYAYGKIPKVFSLGELFDTSRVEHKIGRAHV